MDPALWGLLTKFRETGDSYNFVSQLPGFCGKFRIERKDIEEFWKLYCHVLITKPNFLCGLAEKPYEYVPLLCDVDLSILLKPDTEVPERIYTEKDINIVISCYQRTLKEMIKEWKAKNCTCFLLEKPAYKTNNKLKNGFHLHFPRIWLRRCDIELYILPRVIELLNTEYADQVFQNTNDPNPGDAIDKGVCSRYWLLYGCCKDASKGSYRLTHMYDCQCNEITFEDAFLDYKLFDTDENEIALTSDNYISYLPRILSIRPNSKTVITILKPNLKCSTKERILLAAQLTKINNKNTNVEEALNLARELMPMLSPRRAETYDSWLNIGWMLYNIGNGCSEALDLWIEFSAKTERDNFDEAFCIHQWHHNMVNAQKFTVGSLRYYAGIDSPEKYEAWKKLKTRSRIKDIVHGGHNDLAKMLYDYYGTTFVCASAEKSGTWYEFREHKWVRTEKGLALRKKISDDLVSKISEEMRRIHNIMSDQGEDQDQEGLLKFLRSIIGKLKHASFKNAVMTECVEVFHDQDFLIKLDADTHLLGFTNGVLDLHDMCFRPGKPEDYISFSTGYEFREYQVDDPDVLDVMDFFEKVFPDPILRVYFLEYCASLLRGGNFNKIFLAMTGDGDNAKSVTIDFLEQTLGQYAMKFPTSLFTGKRAQSSSANPELIRMHGRRFATVQEPDRHEVINVGVLKELSGNDKLSMRGLYQEQKEVTNQLKIALVTNKLPRLSSDDQAHWNRIMVLPFEAKFPKNPKDVPETEEEQIKKKIFPRDPHFDRKLPKMKQAFMWKLFQILKHIDQKGYTPAPPKVLEATATYRRNNDVFLQFYTENIYDKDPDGTCTLQELYGIFQVWFHSAFPNLKMPIRNDLAEDLYQRLGPADNGIWHGYRIKQLNDHVKEGNAVILAPDELAPEPGHKLALQEMESKIENMKLKADGPCEEDKIQLEVVN